MNMKAKKLKYLLVGIFAIVACTESNNEENVGNGEKTAVVSLYSEEGCLEENLLAGNVLVTESAPVSLDLNVPIHCQNVYMKYVSTSGERVKALVLSTPSRSTVRSTASGPDDLLSFDWATTRIVPVSVSLPEDAVSPTSEEDAGFRFYHNTGVAMFEDNWPVESGQDNDLNDVVVEYDLKVTECQNEELLPSQGYKEGLKLTLDVRAKGGIYPTRLGGVLEDLDSKYIDKVVTRIVLKKGQGMEDEWAVGTTSAEARETFNDKQQYCKVWVDMKNGSPVITMDGLADLGNNSTFFQTTEGYIKVGLPMLRAEVTLTGKLRSELSTTESAAQLKAFWDLILDTKKQNFFITTHDGRETHMKGYKPTYSYARYETDSKGEMVEGTTYCNKNGFVWGFKVPVGVAHAYEKVLFDDAYPKFRGWVNSNGAENRDWYLHPEAGKIVRYW